MAAVRAAIVECARASEADFAARGLSGEVLADALELRARLDAREERRRDAAEDFAVVDLFGEPEERAELDEHDDEADEQIGDLFGDELDAGVSGEVAMERGAVAMEEAEEEQQQAWLCRAPFAAHRQRVLAMSF